LRGEQPPALTVTLVGVLQWPERDLDSAVSLPLRLLCLVAGIASGIMFGRRLSTVDQHAAQYRVGVASTLGLVAGLQEPVREQQRVHQCLVSRQLTRRVEQAVPREVTF